MNKAKFAVVAGILLGQATLIGLALFTGVIGDIDAMLIVIVLMLFLVSIVLPLLPAQRNKS